MNLQMVFMALAHVNPTDRHRYACTVYNALDRQGFPDHSAGIAERFSVELTAAEVWWDGVWKLTVAADLIGRRTGKHVWVEDVSRDGCLLAEGGQA